jgi:hypothetical protein
MPIRAILAKMRHDGCGGLAGKAELVTGIEGVSSRPVRKIVLRDTIESGRMPSGLALEPDAAALHEKAALQSRRPGVEDRAARRLSGNVRPDASTRRFGNVRPLGRLRPAAVLEPMPPRAGDTAARGECRNPVTHGIRVAPESGPMAAPQNGPPLGKRRPEFASG